MDFMRHKDNPQTPQSEWLAEIERLRQRVSALEAALPAGHALLSGPASGEGSQVLPQDVRIVVQPEGTLAQDLQSSPDFIQKVVNAMAQGLTVTDAEGRFLFVNPAYARLLGYTPQELLGRQPDEFIYPPDLQILADAHLHRQAGETTTYEVRVRQRSGGLAHVTITATPHYRNGAFAGAIAVITDLTERERIERELRQQYDFAFHAVDTMSQGLLITDVQGKIEFTNSGLLRLTGYPLEAMLTKNPTDFVAPQDRPILEAHHGLRKEGEASDYELRLLCADGSLKEVLVSGVPRYRDGTFIGTVAVLTDLSERKRAEQALRESEARYRLLAENIADVVWVLDVATLRFTYVSPSVARLRGFNAQEVLAQSAAEALAPGSLAAVSSSLAMRVERFLAGDETMTTMTTELEQIHKDGGTVWTEAVTTLLRDAKGRVSLLGVSRDISARRQTDQALRDGEIRYRAMIEASTDAILMGTVDGKIVDCNNASSSIYGYRREEMLDKNIADLLSTDLSGSLLDILHLHKEDGRAWFKSFNRRKNGEVFPVEVSVQVVLLGRELRVISFIRDITMSEQTSAALNRRVQTLSALYQTALEISTQPDLPTLLRAIVERASQLVDASMGALYLVRPDGHSLEMVVCNNLPHDFTGTVMAFDEGLAGRVARSGESMLISHYTEWEGRSRVFDGVHFGNMLGAPLKIGQRLIGVIVVTDNRNAAPYTQEDVQIVELLASQAAVAVHNAQLHAAAQSELAERRRAEDLQRALYQISEAAQTAENLDDLYPRIHSVVAGLMPARNFYICQLDITTGLISFPYHIDVLDPQPVSVTLKPSLTRFVIKTGQPLLATPEVWQAMRDRGEIELHGTPPVDWLGVPLKSPQGIIGMMAVQTYNEQERLNAGHQELLTFVSNQVAMAIERKRVQDEIHQLNLGLEQRVRLRTSQLEAANKELEAFAYSVSHDLRAPLRAIDGYSRILIEDYSGDETRPGQLDSEGTRMLKTISANVQKMNQLITDILALSRITRVELNRVSIDMTALAQTAFNDASVPEVLEKFDFTLHPLPNAYGDPTLIRQVWANLLSNAIKYTLPQDIRHIEISGEVEGKMCVYCVRDSGVGFDPAYAHKLFGVFQRLHGPEEFEGTGVGLAIVQRIVHRHNGQTWATSAPGQGASFFFSLPSQGSD